MKNLTLETINKNLLLLAFISLIFKRGSFAASHIPNPFEIIFVVVVILTLVDFVKNKKFKEFWLSISKKIWIAIFCLIVSIILGWLWAIFYRGIPLTFNNFLEFGGFFIGLMTFILVMFYTRDDENYAKKSFYAVLALAAYALAVFPPITDFFGLSQGSAFLGFTTNPNIISKALLIPTIFFITFSLFEEKSKWLKLAYFAISCALVSLLFWTGSRGALVSMSFGSLFVYIIFVSHKFRWPKIFIGGFLIFAIICGGYLFSPKVAREGFINRNFDDAHTQLLKAVVRGEKDPQVFVSGVPIVPESRLTLWPTYFREIIKNPLGVGPNTHMGVTTSKGRYWEIGPHNTYIEIALWGGAIGFLSFIFMLFGAFKNMREKLKLNFNPLSVALFAILVVLSVSIIFNDSLQFYWFFIILALAKRK
jgi:O-antigen ligase